LGFAATQNECDKYCIYKGERQYGLYYRVNIYGDNIEDIPTKCPRKQAEYRARSKNALVSKITVVPKGRGQYYGFELDNNHRYVLGNFTVTHNTSLVREGISKILGREFAFIALGGAGDSSYLEGHSYTYEGSTWGKIVQILIDSKCMNPVIYFDELDKVSDTPRGEEIIGILTHLTDTSQNSQFHDKYFSEVDFDLSKCLFIFSYNDESKVNPILRDRMYRIQTKGYDTKEKVIIARNFLLPKIREQVNFSEDDIIIPDETIQYIVSNKSLTKEEDGVRNLKRCLEIIYTKLNLFRLVKPDTKLFGKEIELEVKFPFTVTKKEVDIFIKNEEHQNQSMLAMYC
jgi:ATP-dependent Lon protease